MKQITIIAALFLSLNNFAQDNTKTPELSCFNKWAAKFDDRGADPIADGVYDDVIITNRQGSKHTCSNGKAEVKGGMLLRCYILLSDGSHEEVKKSWKNKSNEHVTIVNGMSRGMMSVHGEIVNVLWPNKIKAKKAKPTVAPDPVDD